MKQILTLLLILTLTSCASPGAIGVVYNQHGTVRRVFPNSPAEQAGILVGDTIFNTDDLRGSIGSMCLVKYRHENIYIEKLVPRVDVNNFKNW